VGGDVVRMGEMRNAYKILVRKREWKGSLRGPRNELEYNSKIDLK